MDDFRAWYRDLPEKKRYFELITAALSIPVLATVLITNVSNLQSNTNEKKEANGAVIVAVTAIPDKNAKNEIDDATVPTREANDNVAAVTTVSCKPEIGPITIVSPKEGETVSGEPICFNISYKTGEYCKVVWSYRIDDAQWSEYTDKSICVYGMTSGKKHLQLNVKSIASDEEKTLSRNFIFENNVTPSPTAIISSTPGL